MKNDVAIEVAEKWLVTYGCVPLELVARCVVIMCKMLFGHFSFSLTVAAVAVSFSLFPPVERKLYDVKVFTTSMRFYIRQKLLFGILVSFDIH